MKICVLGAGVGGLPIAFNLLRKYRDIEVEVLADKFNEQTTSYGAAGLFLPTRGCLGLPDAVESKWANEGWQWFNSLASSEMGPSAGVTLAFGYVFSEDSNKFHFDSPIVNEKILTKNVKLSLCADSNFMKDFSHAYRTETFMAEGRRYLSYLQQEILKLGGKFKRRRITNLRELIDEYDLTIVACGIGARELLGDMSLTHVRGYIIRVKAPWIRQFLLGKKGEKSVYIVPCIDSVVIGGVYQENNHRQEICKKESNEIWMQACDVCPSLKSAKWLEEWVGFRPKRSPHRSEYGGVFSNESSQMHVFYSYGLSGDGMSMGWGASLDIIDKIDATLINKFRHRRKCYKKSNL